MRILTLLTLVLTSSLSLLTAQEPAPLRPPATPLIAHDPYFSVWSTTELLTAQPPKHWTGTDQPLLGLIRVDGKTLRFMGGGPRWVSQMPVLAQKSQRLTPTRTIYTFAGEGVELDLTFVTPALAGDMVSSGIIRALRHILFQAIFMMQPAEHDCLSHSVAVR
jgi:Domain of unknown function (DUF4964)